jgi:hypothetical protein
MKWKTLLIALAFGAATALVAQETTTTKQETTTTRTSSVSGSVVKYTPGQTIVIRDSSGRETTYTISSSADVPAEVQVGKTVTISTEPSASGSGPAVVTRIQTTTMDSSGNLKTTTERTEMSPSSTTQSTTTESSSQTMSPSQTTSSGQTSSSGQSSTSSSQTKVTTQETSQSPSGTSTKTTTTIYGTVTAYEPGQSITIENPGHQTVTYTIDTQSQLPKDIAVGKTVTITTRTVTGSSSPVVRTVTYRTVTKKSSSTNPQ